MPSFTTVFTAPCDPGVTFAYMIDLQNWPSFEGWGPLPGIVRAELAPGEAMAAGARVRVTNTDGSVHHETVTAFLPDRHYRVRMELGDPARRLLSSIEESVELSAIAGGTRIERQFTVTPRSRWTAPLAWVVAKLFLRRAVERHNRAVTRALTPTPPSSRGTAHAA
jgi:hypothetical protein